MTDRQGLNFLYFNLYDCKCVGCGKDFAATGAKIQCDIPVTLTYDGEVSEHTAHLCQECFNKKCMPKEVELTIVPLDKVNAKKASEFDDRN